MKKQVKEKGVHKPVEPAAVPGSGHNLKTDEPLCEKDEFKEAEEELRIRVEKDKKTDS